MELKDRSDNLAVPLLRDHPKTLEVVPSYWWLRIRILPVCSLMVLELCSFGCLWLQTLVTKD